jgi:hypothetical protein
MAAGRRYLVPRGFAPLAARTWVRCRVQGIHDVCMFVRERGGVLWAHWGFHLDGIPVIRGDRISNPKVAAAMDLHLRFDPYDVDPDACRHDDWAIVQLSRTPSDAIGDLRKLESPMLACADETFRSVQNWTDLIPLFEGKRAGTGRRYSWSTCPDLGFSLAFTHVRSGRREDAMAAYLEWEARCSGQVHNDFVLEKARKRFVRALEESAPKTPLRATEF